MAQGAIKEDFQNRVIKKPANQLIAEAKVKGQTTSVKKINSGTNKQTKTNINLSKIENESVKLPKATREMSLAMQNGRTEKKLTQKQLAQKCNLKPDIVKGYENGTAIVKQSEVAAINRALGIKLVVPKPQAQEPQ